MQKNSNKIFLKRIRAYLLFLVFIITTACGQDSMGNLTGKPLWTFTPLTATTIAVPSNGTAMVQYLVSSHSGEPHTLTMQPIGGITQITTGLNVCENPFVLKSRDSCILSLEINGSHLSSPIAGGPIVCQQGSNHHCYQPGGADALNITQAPPT